jgi:hypothetical protein
MTVANSPSTRSACRRAVGSSTSRVSRHPQCQRRDGGPCALVIASPRERRNATAPWRLLDGSGAHIKPSLDSSPGPASDAAPVRSDSSAAVGQIASKLLFATARQRLYVDTRRPPDSSSWSSSRPTWPMPRRDKRGESRSNQHQHRPHRSANTHLRRTITAEMWVVRRVAQSVPKQEHESARICGLRLARLPGDAGVSRLSSAIRSAARPRAGRAGRSGAACRSRSSFR